MNATISPETQCAGSLQQVVSRRPYYDDGQVTIYHGDCRQILDSVPTIDLVLTDPPYGMAYNSGWTKASSAIRSDGVRQGVRLLRAALFEMQTRLAPDAHFYTFCHWESWPDFYDTASTYFNLRNALIWWKDRGGMGDLRHEFGKDYEVILFGARGRRELTGSRDGCVIEGIAPCPPNKRNHPTEKPDALMRYIIEYARKLGIKELYGEVLRENEAMLRLNRALNFKIHATFDDPGVLHVSLPLN